MRKAFIYSFCLLILTTALSAVPVKKYKTYTFTYENVLGTSLDLRLSAVNQSSAEDAEQRVLAEIDRLNNILSSYTPHSEFNKWGATADKPTKVSKELYEVLALFDNWTVQTKGALNPAAETVGRVWKKAAKDGQLPANSELLGAVQAAQQKHWLLNPAEQTATRLGNAPLALNTFVKGYIINRAVEKALGTADVNGIVLNVGGDIFVRGKDTQSIDISDPRSDAENASPMATLNVKNKAIATSGNYRRGFDVAGKWYSHIVDPRTATPVENVISATVVADDPATAGALATAFNVLSPAESKALATRYPDAEFLIVDKDGNKFESSGWSTMVDKSNQVAISVALEQAPKFELLMNVELALVQGQRIYRPFVAFWIESEDRKPVRNIAVWYNKAKWLPDLKNWYRDYGLEFNAADAAKSISSATRTPGKYTVKWDGLDDAGKPVKPGNYIVNIEVVREHGTYQILSKKMNFNNSPQKYTLPNNVEVASASLEYRRKAK